MAEEMAGGIDVSSWQRVIDWAQVKTAGTAFAFAKATEGTNYTDPTFARNWPAMKDVGLVRGAYLFYRPSENPEAQAEYMARVVGPLEPGDMPPALDVEVTDNVSGSALVNGVERCLLALQRAFGLRPIIYTSPGFWGSYMRYNNGERPTWPVSYPLWVAHFTDAPAPLIPIGWTKWEFWQYSSTGRVPGVTTPVDLDWFSGTEADLRWWVHAPKVTNQQMINAFYAAFGDNYWEAITRAGLTWLAIPASNRPLLYTGPRPEEMPGLSDEERAQLRVALDDIVAPLNLRDILVPLTTLTAPSISNATLQHAFYLAFGQAYPAKIEKAGLVESLSSRAERDAAYTGPPIEDLPGLRKAEKAKLLKALDRAQGLR